MYVIVTKIGRFFKELSPVVTATVALLLVSSYIILMRMGLQKNMTFIMRP